LTTRRILDIPTAGLATGSPRVNDLTEGQFVRSPENRLGVGKVVNASPEHVEIEYFDNVSRAGRERRTVRRAQAEPVQLSLQRRCYWQEDGRWRVGRIVWQGDAEYGVRLPDSDADSRVQERDLFVRWNRPITDPIDVLVALGNESPYFHSCRSPFVETVTAQRAASHGMYGVISSVLELYEHQLEVVRRVLEDPLQRYLLADEVGLGKTIEAGLVIRQYLTDHPEGHVVVLTPPLLRRQWVAELKQKFLIDDFDRAVIAVLSHDNPESWELGSRDSYGRYSPHRQAGLLVIDEVHHLAAQADGESGAAATYKALSDLAKAVPRLLLLSATPLLNNEQTFLAMLHLLDPEIYLLSDLEGFRRRVRDRQALGTTVFTLRPDTPAFLLREKLGALSVMIPSDEQLGVLIEDVTRAIEGGDHNRIAAAVVSVRAHVSETYRLHRRLLRTRRTEALTLRFPIRGRSLPVELDASSEEERLVQEWLDDWREYVRATTHEGDPSRLSRERAFVALAERASSESALVSAAARFRLSGDEVWAQRAELTRADVLALQGWPVDSSEREILERAAALDAPDSSWAALTSMLRTRRMKTVVFSSFTTTAQNLAEHLASEFGEAAVARHLLCADPAQVEEELERFRGEGGACWILVCDRSAEEGRNFQFAEQAVHYDLPMSPNRLEQRIGRLDRYGRGEPVPTHVVARTHDTIDDRWRACLHDGFGVFSASIASLQYAVDTLLPDVYEALFDDGPVGLDAVSITLPERLGRERTSVAEQDALDAIEVADRAGSLGESLDDLEDLWFQIQVATEGLLCEHLGNLRFYRMIDKQDERFRSYRLTPPGRGPTLNSMPLVAWDMLRSNFRSVVDRVGTYSRRSAVAHPGARLFRIGEPLVEALTDYIRWDDRGQTFAFWRLVPGVSESIFFRFDYVVEADTARACGEVVGRDAEARALQRKADAFFPPSLTSIWTSLEGEEVNEAEVLELLVPPYEPKRGDVNLNLERRWALEQLVGEEDWEDRCRTARAKSENLLRSSTEFRSTCDAASLAFERSAARVHLQRRTRLAFMPDRQRAAEERELRTDTETAIALAAGMRSPSVRLDAVGAIILSSIYPAESGFPGSAVR
jgi:ATP-dependent helicase HepA